MSTQPSEKTSISTLRIEFYNKHLPNKMLPPEITERISEALPENQISHRGDYAQRSLRFPNGNRNRLEFYEVRPTDDTHTYTEVTDRITGIVTNIMQDWRQSLAAAAGSPQPEPASPSQQEEPTPTGRIDVFGTARGSNGVLVVEGEALSQREVRNIGNMLQNVYGITMVEQRSVDTVGGYDLGVPTNAYNIAFSGTTLPTATDVNNLAREVRQNINTGRGHNER